MTDLIIRTARLEDLDTLVAFNQAMALETEKLQLDPVVLRAGVKAVVEDAAKGFYLVAEREGRIIGQVMVTHEWSDWRNADWWWLQSVYVAEDSRRHGVFQALYAEVVARSQKEKVHGIRLYVERENHRAQTVYTRLGMKHARYELFELGEE